MLNVESQENISEISGFSGDEKSQMYKILYRFILVLILTFLLYLFGCAEVEHTIYLGDVEVNGPLTPPPTHLTINKEPGDVTISPRFSTIASRKKIIGSTGDQYGSWFRLPDNSLYTAKDQNLEWDIMENTFGADIGIKVGEKTSLFGGISFSSGNNINLTGGNLGIGFHNHQGNPAVRLDLGLNIQKYNYFAITIVQTKVSSIFGDDEYTEIYGDKGSSVNLNPFGSVTVNSTNDSGFINYFGSLGFFTQSLLGFNPGETSYKFFPFIIHETTVDERADFTAYFLIFNPGFSLSLNDQIRILFSSKILKELSISSSEWYIMPSVQMDFQL